MIFMKQKQRFQNCTCHMKENHKLQEINQKPRKNTKIKLLPEVCFFIDLFDNDFWK